MFLHIIKQVKVSVSYAIIAVVTLSLLFVFAEPAILLSQGPGPHEFVVRQQITPEISLTLSDTIVTMVGSIQGFSGGNATGSIQATVQANQGYTVSLQFENSPAMLGEDSGDDGILDYPSGATPTFNFVPGTAAYFAYTVSASTTSDLDEKFLDNDTDTCGGGGVNFNAHSCWMGPSTTAAVIIDRDTSSPDGANSTVTFRVNVPQNPTPSLEVDWYVATATLTAALQ